MCDVVVVAVQLSARVHAYVYRCIHLQASIGIAVYANRCIHGRKVVCPMLIFCFTNSNNSTSISVSDADMASGVESVINSGREVGHQTTYAS